MTNNKKLIIAPLAHNRDHYESMTARAEETCYYNSGELGIQVFHLYAQGNGVVAPEGSYILRGNKFYSDSAEKYTNLLYKTLDFFEYALENLDFDYIFRTNSGSYINLNSIQKFTNTLPDKNVYCGVEGFLRDITFASGSGFFVSKDIVEILVDNRSQLLELAKTDIDDVCIGALLCGDMGIPVTIGARRLDITLNEGKIEILGSSGLDPAVVSNVDCYHYYFGHAYTGTHAPEYYDAIHDVITNS